LAKSEASIVSEVPLKALAVTAPCTNGLFNSSEDNWGQSNGGQGLGHGVALGDGLGNLDKGHSKTTVSFIRGQGDGIDEEFSGMSFAVSSLDCLNPIQQFLSNISFHCSSYP
jgi:hypothetical protein